MPTYATTLSQKPIYSCLCCIHNVCQKEKEYIHVFNSPSTIAGRFNSDGMGNENCLSPKWVFSLSIVTLSTKIATFAKLKVEKSIN
jgi:hypothetical protein